MKRIRKGWKGWLCLLLAGWLLFPSALGEGGNLTVTVEGGILHPWDTALIQYTMPEAGRVDLVLLDEAGEECFVIARDVLTIAGQNSLFWNGTYNYDTAPEGTWRLALVTEDFQRETQIVIGAPLPLDMGDPDLGEEGFPVETAEPHEILSDEPEEHLAEEQEPDAVELAVSVSETASEQVSPLLLKFTPGTTSPYDGQDDTLNYWTLPMDIHDEAAVWQVLTAPITVVENGKGEKAQVVLRSEPDAESAGVGTVTCATQGVHVLERGEEWSLVECYSSSFHDSPILNWNTLVQGYVPTRYLKEETPNQQMGMVVDKLTQRLYVFMEGHLYSTLLVSTGLANSRQPYNETRSGEFLLTSKVGTFASDNLKCAMAIRFNKGDLMHEVPYIVQSDGSSNYKVCEARLGTKASHGCIRVQRKKTPEGVNMAWIWASLRNNSKTRLLIWEDWQGRQIEVPSDDTLLYYNPNKGKYYHSQPTCNSTRAGVTFTSFTYGELEDAKYSRLTRCEYCAPALRKAEIEEINAVYAFGVDHDPVLTEARESCPRPLK